jgi:hypothetical protein
MSISIAPNCSSRYRPQQFLKFEIQQNNHSNQYRPQQICRFNIVNKKHHKESEMH